MPKKLQQNSKAVAANAKKEANKQAVEAKKREEEERKFAEEWSVGVKGKGKKDADAEKKAASKARKDEAAKLLEEEEKQLPRKPQVRPDKVAERKTKAVEQKAKEFEKVESFVATNIDDALELLDTINISDGSSRKENEVDRHPERRVKAAYAEYEDRMLPILKKENPSLRLSQLKEMLWKMWQKAPENPFNQLNVAHNATQEEIKAVVDAKKKATEDRLRE